MLYVTATPIGNLEDITLRALRVLKEVDFVLAEDTRKTGLLLKHFGIKKKLISFYEHNEAGKVQRVVKELGEGKDAALVSGAGTPAVSDPGYKLIKECRRKNLAVTSLPGPSSVVNALVLTTIAHDKFIFLGYMPRKKGERRKILEKIQNWKAAVVFFESPYRLLGSLRDLREFLGSRQITIAREMTKKFEEILELDIEEALKHFEKKKPKGEFTVVVDSCSKKI